MAFTARAALLTALISFFPVLALAQASAPTDTPAQPGGTPSDTAAPPAGTAPDTAAPSASVSTAPIFPATGYGWSTTPSYGSGPGTSPRRSR